MVFWEVGGVKNVDRGETVECQSYARQIDGAKEGEGCGCKAHPEFRARIE